MIDNIVEYLYSINCHADYKIEEIAQDIYSMMEDEFAEKIARIFSTPEGYIDLEKRR